MAEAPSRTAGWDLFRPLSLVLALLLLLLVVLPVFWLAVTSLTGRSGEITLANYAALVTDPTLRRAFGLAIGMALAVGLLSCAIATPLAWLCARTDLPGRTLVRALVIASFVTPPFLGAIAWEVLAAPNSGLLNQLYRTLFDLPPYEHAIDIYSFEGLIFVMSLYSFPYVFTLVANALDRVPSDLEDASAILGGGRWATLRRITLPIVLPAVLAGSLIAVLQALTMFGSPAILALPAGFHVITTKIWSLFQYPPRLGLAAACAVPLMVITILLLRGQRWILGRKGYAVLAGKSGVPRLVPLGRWKLPAAAFAFFVLLLAILLPYLALLKMALTRNISEPFSLASLTLHNFAFVFLEFSPTQLALKNTLLLGFLAATIGTFVALMVAYLVSRRAVAHASWLGLLATAPAAIPGIVLGVGLFLAYAQPPIMLYGTLWILLLAFLTIEMPAGYQQLSSALTAIHPELEEASRILGGSRLATIRRVTAPLLRANIVAAWCFVFIGTIRELSATILLTNANTKLVSVIIYDLNESGNLGAISVLGLTLLAVTFAVVLLANRAPGAGGSWAGRA